MEVWQHQYCKHWVLKTKTLHGNDYEALSIYLLFIGRESERRTLYLHQEKIFFLHGRMLMFADIM